jgi:hypothetical protein
VFTFPLDLTSRAGFATDVQCSWRHSRRPSNILHVHPSETSLACSERFMYKGHKCENTSVYSGWLLYYTPRWRHCSPSKHQWLYQLIQHNIPQCLNLQQNCCKDSRSMFLKFVLRYALKWIEKHHLADMYVVFLIFVLVGYWHSVNINSFCMFSVNELLIEMMSLVQYCVCVLKQWLHHSLTPTWC